MDKLLRTRVEITYAGQDITRDIAPDLLSFSFTDNEGGKADDLSITLRNDHGRWSGPWLPSQGDQIKAAIVQTGIGARFDLPCGTFTVDEVVASWSPAVVSINGVSVPTETDIARRRRSRAWESVRLSEIVQDVARAGGLATMYLIDNDPAYERRDQRDESDLAFLQRVCESEGFSLKCTDEQVVVFDPREREEAPPVATFRLGTDAITSCRFTAQSYSIYAQCVVEYVDPQTGKLVQYTHTEPGAEGGRTLKVVQRAEDTAEAERIAEAALYQANRGEVECSLAVVGDTRLSAGQVVEVGGAGRFDGRYYIEKATHTVASGYVTNLEMRSTRNGRGAARGPDGLESIIGE